MSTQRKKNALDPVGFIQLVFFDDATGEVVTVGGAAFFSVEEDKAAWNNIKAFDGESSFQADRLDSRRDIYDERRVSAQTCEALTGKPIATLIAQGRAALAAELRGYQGTAVRLVVDNAKQAGKGSEP